MDKHENSLRKAVLFNYPGNLDLIFPLRISEVNWKTIHWTERKSKYHWNSHHSQFTFLRTLEHRYHLQNPLDWNRISLNLIKHSGGRVPS